jgi:cell division transport system ATP-binding protein
LTEPATALDERRAAESAGAPLILLARMSAGPLQAIDLTLAPGATAIIHGGSAAGKSTLLDVMRAALLPTDGDVRLMGADVLDLRAPARRNLRRHIGFIAQTPRLVDTDVLFHAVAAPLRLTAPLDQRAIGDVNDILAYLGLSEVAGERVATLCDTHRRLAAVARAFVAAPRILLADEPLAGLSPDAMARVLRLLSEVARQRAAVVIATQTPETYAALPALRMRLDRGRMAP